MWRVRLVLPPVSWGTALPCLLLTTKPNNRVSVIRETHILGATSFPKILDFKYGSPHAAYLRNSCPHKL